MKIRARVLVEGRVHGVFFRAETLREARKHHVTGWVRNLADGRVEAVLEGEESMVQNVVEFCRRGPRGARVTSTEVSLEPYTGEFEGFQILWGY